MEATTGLCPRCGSRTGVARYCPNCGFCLLAASVSELSELAAPPDEVGSVVNAAEGAAHSSPPGAGRRGWNGRGNGHRRALRAGPAPNQLPPADSEPAGETPIPDLMSVLAVPTGPRGYARVIERRAVAAGLLALARSSLPLEDVRRPGDAAAVFLRRYDTRRATQEAYARDLADWFVWLRHAAVDPFDATLATIESYAREVLPSGRLPAPATVARRLACLSHYYRRAVYAGLVPRNPVEEAQRPRIPEQSATLGISKARARLLIQAARASGARETLLVLLMLELGLRVSEVVGADIEDLSEQGRHRVLTIKGKGQSTKASLVPLNGAVTAAIVEITAGRTSGPLLTTSTGNRLTRQHAGRLIKRLGHEIGVPSLHPHTLRHAFVTLALDEGASLRDVQDAARHADPRTTRRYDRNRNNLDRHPTHHLVTVLEP
jgi:integrase/recombinase XerD